MIRCHLDYESRSIHDLNTVGLDRYATSPSTKVILAAYAFDDGPVHTWEPHVSPIPSDLEDALYDPNVLIYAWNAEFERVITNWVLDIPVPVNRFRCAMAQARYMSLPGGLDDCSKILRMDTEGKFISRAQEVYLGKFKKLTKKDAQTRISTLLVNKFCLPTNMGGRETLFGITEPYFKDWDTDPDDWELFKLYNRQDVVAERALYHRMKNFQIPEFEWANYRRDQECNDRGIYTDLSLVQGAVSLAETIKKELTEELLKLTGLENPNSRDQMLEWCRKNGFPYHGLAKNFVNQALAGTEINDDCRKALTIRQQAAKTSDSKFYAILDRLGSDSRLRYSYSFMGAGRTHRWSGHGVQTQNLSRPVDEVNKRLSETIEIVRKADYNGLKSFKTQPLDVLASCVRSVFRAKPGNKLLICDLSAIENRVLGYICKAPSILKVFEESLDPYKYFAVDLYGKPYDEITKLERQNAKPPVLGCGYGLSGGEQRTSEDGDIIYTGLMKYGRSMNIHIDKELADRSVEVFRKKHWEVVQNWKDLEKAAKKCIRNRQPQIVNNIIRFSMVEDVLVATMPSGRSLHYLQPKIVEVEKQGREGPYLQESIEYWGMIQEKHIFGRTYIYGSKFLENFDQSISRDLLVHGMKRCEEIGLTSLVMHTHDELVYEVPINSSYTVKDLRECMIAAPPWGNKQLIVDAAGFESDIYRKE